MSKPRMGESADQLWSAIKEASGGVVHEGRVLYPVLRVVCGDDFTLDARGQLQMIVKGMGGLCVRDVSDAEADEFHRDLARDGVQVLLLTSPGFGSGYGERRALRELHSPSGLSFSQVDSRS